ncbi:MAG: cysteine peptidase family C39 domain-containing protein [Planctomycetota bacterium]|jgi:hypothetical protein
MIIRAILEIAFLIAAAGVIAFLGFKISRHKRLIWMSAFFLGFAGVVSVLILNRMPDLFYRLPLFWFGEGRNEFIVMSLCLPFVFGILIPQLPHKRQQISVSVLMTLGTFYFLVPPFLEPALLYGQFQDQENQIIDDVCFQQTNFTCGPAAAVTALAQLGIEANEGRIAIAAYSTRVWGTPATSLAGALEGLYRNEQVKCEVRRFAYVNEMKDCCPVIAIVKFRPMIDHYVTVLEIERQRAAQLFRIQTEMAAIRDRGQTWC